MSQSSYLSPLLWLKKEADKEKMSATQCQIFFFYYQMFELLFARESDMKDLCLGTKGFYFSQLEKNLLSGVSRFLKNLEGKVTLKANQEVSARKALFLALTTSQSDWQELAPVFDFYQTILEKDYIVKVIGDKHFVLKRQDATKLTARQTQTLEILSQSEDLVNPVYVTLGEKGVLLLD
ncbi:hypothetical protein A6B46_09325 [Streptococcus pneumoniae]|uniref:hypothetical protein n=1 Tax=Streptococcus pneumoniae TaxID=1313 RepID=UPI0007C975CF|nr:hypothetical protein [Streptococcus pneumoniae]OAH01113.1 hypothetical protein A6B46_09325 [Streptococcus pneumoniae]